MNIKIKEATTIDLGEATYGTQLTVLAITCLNVCLVGDHGAGAVRWSHLGSRRRVGVGTGKVVAEH